MRLRLRPGPPVGRASGPRSGRLVPRGAEPQAFADPVAPQPRPSDSSEESFEFPAKSTALFDP